MKDPSVAFVNTTGSFPNVLGRNITVPGDGLGTEWIAEFVNNHWGAQQDLLNRASLTPDGVTEATGSSQSYEAMQKCFGAPGEIVGWMGPGDPSAADNRLLQLDGTVLLIANYTDLVNATYIGDGNNNDNDFIGFFKTSDAGGTLRDTAGTYFVLPDIRGLFLRGIDPLATYDPDGASRAIPQLQQDAFETHGHELLTLLGNDYVIPSNIDASGATPAFVSSASAGADRLQAPDSSAAIIGPTSNDNETRSINVNTNWCIRY
jgi:hypothetical protein